MEQKKTLTEYRQSLKNFLSPSITFTILLIIVIWLWVRGIIGITDLSGFDFVIMFLAVFRVVRLISDDSIFNFPRNAIKYDREIVEENGEEMVVFKPVEYGIRKTITSLIECPWCIGIWTTFILFVVYQLHPVVEAIVIVFAIATVAGFLKLFSKWIVSHTK